MPVGRWVKTLLFASVPFGWLSAWTYARSDIESQVLNSIWSATFLSLSLVIVITIMQRSRTIVGQTRWLAVSFTPFYLFVALWFTLNPAA